MHVAALGCTTCTNGRLVFMTRNDSGATFLDCDECMSLYVDVTEAGEPVRDGWEFELGCDIAYATAGSIRRRGWERYVDRRAGDGEDGT